MKNRARALLALVGSVVEDHVIDLDLGRIAGSSACHVVPPPVEQSAVLSKGHVEAHLTTALEERGVQRLDDSQQPLTERHPLLGFADPRECKCGTVTHSFR